MSPRVKQAVKEWSGVVGMLVSLVVLGTAFVKYGRRDGELGQKLEAKVDKVDYQKDRTELTRELGEMHGDIRVIRAAICSTNPGACR